MFTAVANQTSSDLTKVKGRSSDLTINSQVSNMTPNKKSVRIYENTHLSQRK